MIDVESVRRLLGIADTSKDPYAVAQVAGELLEMNGSDAAAQRAYAQALAALKITAANERPAGVASGVVPWASRARRFAANLEVLAERFPEAAALIRTVAGELERYELHLAADGNFQIYDTTLSGRAAWLGGLADHKATASLWRYDNSVPQMVNPIAFEGLGYGWLFLEAFRTTERSFLNYSCPFYIVERDPMALAMLLHVQDLQAVLRSPRVRLFAGEEALETFGAALTAHSTWTLPGVFVKCRLLSGASVGVEACVEDLRRKRCAQHERWAAEADAYYGEKHAAFWREHFNSVLAGEDSRPLRVLGITSRFTTVLQYSMAEVAAAAGAWKNAAGVGAEMRVAIEPDDQSLECPILEMIATFKPDLIVQISRMRHENPVIPKNVPFICWDQDSLACMRTPAATASLDALTYVAGHGAIFGYTNLSWPRENCIFCHPAGAAHRYHAAPISAEARERYACDFSYISNASETPESFGESLSRRWNTYPALKALFQRAAAIVHAQSDAGRAWDYVGVLNLVRSEEVCCGEEIAPEKLKQLAMDLSTFADRCFRHTTLGWIGRWCKKNGKTLRLYGKGWSEHAELKAWAAGTAQPGEEVRAIYQASRINLQIIETGFLHSRSLDGLAAGGFFLTRKTSVDGLGCADVATRHELARWVAANGILTEEELDNVRDPLIRDKIATTRAYYLRHGVSDPLCPSLHVWATIPPAGIVFPELNEITFEDEASFGEMARRYLADDALRATLANRMHTIVHEQFSYDARWKTFLEAVRRGLNVRHIVPEAIGA